MQQLNKAGFAVFDDITVTSFLSNKEVLIEEWETRGGYRTIKEIISLINTENIDSYYDALIKSNMILRLYDEGFPVERDYDTLRLMTAEELYDYYDYKLNNIVVGKIEKMKPVDLSTGYEEFIENWDQGRSVGYKIGFPVLNYMLAGVHKKNLLLHLGHIGRGKTTTAILMYILPVIESGENVCIIANEQEEDEWRQMILATVLSNKVNYFKMNRQKLTFGKFTEDDKVNLKKASDWLHNCKGKIEFINLNDYQIDNAQKIIRKYGKLGFGLFVFDTLKPVDDASDRAWAEFSEVAKKLFQLAKSEDVAIIATAQLSAESMSRRHLDLSCTGKSRSIAETAAQVVMFRALTVEEKLKYKPYSYKRDENGKATSVKLTYELDPEKDYIVVFIPKNRFGAVTPQIIYERNMSFNTMHEIGRINIPFDGFKAR